MKKIFSLVIVTIILLSTYCYATSGDSTNDNRTYEDGYRDGVSDGYDEGYSDGIGDGRERVPVVTFVETNDLPAAGAGETINLSVTFRNTSIYSAKELTITPDLEDTPLVYERPLKYGMKKTLKNREEVTTSFNIKISEDARIGTYPVKFKVEYKNNMDELFTREDVVYFKFTSERLKPIINI